MKKHILVTGGAGFIGSTLIERLLKSPAYSVTCVDNFDPYYDPRLKRANIAAFLDHPRFRLIEENVLHLDQLKNALTDTYDAIVHLAAKVGVRPSLTQGQEYYAVNVQGTQHMLELARHLGVRQFVFSSSSSVYGKNPQVPWAEENTDLKPISPYAATKLSGEMLGHVYAHLYGIRFVALRFFTVYGPRQRPDLAISKFTRLLYQGKPVPFYGDGSTRRDYTFVEDVADGIMAALHYEQSPYEVFNLGNHSTVALKELLQLLEEMTGREALIDYQPDQPGDVLQTYADIRKAQQLLGYQPATSIRQGIKTYIQWMQLLGKRMGCVEVR